MFLWERSLYANVNEVPGKADEKADEKADQGQSQ